VSTLPLTLAPLAGDVMSTVGSSRFPAQAAASMAATAAMDIQVNVRFM